MSQKLLQTYSFAPDQIERLSLRRVEANASGLDRHPPQERAIALRMMYASGDSTLANCIHFHPSAVSRGTAALQAGCAICVDVRMVEVALQKPHLERLGCSVECAIGREKVVREAQQVGLPRAAIAMRSMAAYLEDGVAVIGTAPTALLALLDLVDTGNVRPALIIGTPVGFVAAAEAKAELMKRDVPFITIEGTRGGAAMGAAAANALLRLALVDPNG